MSTFHRVKLERKPNLTSLAQLFPDKFPALLNSNVHNSKIGRYSILFAQSEKLVKANTLEQLLDLFAGFDRKIKVSGGDNSLPFYSGWFLYISYASIMAWEQSLRTIKHDENQPLAIAIRCQSAIIIDHIEDESWVVADSEDKVSELVKLLDKPIKQYFNIKTQFKVLPDDVQGYINNVNVAKDYIVSGDIYQVNLARKWDIESNTDVDVFALYDSLSKNNPAPFAGLLQTQDFAVISSSPERLIKISDNIIETRPIAGTRPRSKNRAKDKQLIHELINHPKEQAEHIMLIDLERNDLGRVSKIGSVKVDEFMVVESYAKVHHIVSNVSAELDQGVTYYDVIKASFPGGTITGCPKIRCMQIIDELEEYPRGAYTGSMGYITDDGRMDMNILIRTFTLSEKRLSFHAGAGIVYDSVAENEAKESYYKAQALINSL